MPPDRDPPPIRSDRLAASAEVLAATTDWARGADEVNVKAMSPAVRVRQGLDLLEAFQRIPSIGARVRVIEMVRQMADREDVAK